MTPAVLQAAIAYVKQAPPFPSPVAGPWTPDKVPAATQFPYCVLSVVGTAALDWTTDRVYSEPCRLQFSIFARGESEAFSYGRQLAARFDFAPLAPSDGQCLGVLRLNGPNVIRPARRDADGAYVYHVALDYLVTVQGP